MDNCGGITESRLKRRAFRFGRILPDPDANKHTVGAYGIGLKRAIFKMGREAEVTTRTKAGEYRVAITEEWMRNNDLWTLDISRPVDRLADPGTKIVVRKLLPSIAKDFATSSFESELNAAIADYYSTILRKGLRVEINGRPVKPAEFGLLATVSPGPRGIAPFMFRGKIDGVDVSIAVGFFRRPYAPQADDGNSSSTAENLMRTEPAGVTVFCNDRVVALRDRSDLTGWGVGNVPHYHNQFIAISGIVGFDAANAAQIPLTTTKRGLDRTSAVYQRALTYLTAGLKTFADFTNKWKRQEEAASKLFATARLFSVAQLMQSTSLAGKWTKVHKLAGAREFTPTLPLPTAQSPDVNISFKRARTAVREIASGAMDRPSATAGEVGAYCFDITLGRARSKK